MDQQKISSHVFFFPFTWQKESRQEHFMLTQHKTMQKKERIVLDTWQKCNQKLVTDRDYNERVYFYKPAQNVLYEKEDTGDIVYCYEKGGKSAKDCVIIHVEDARYHLTVDAIHLNLYKTGIGLLRFTVINNTYAEQEAIMAINGMSKCVYPYVLPLEKAQQDYFPKSIEMVIGEAHIVETFSKDYKKQPMQIADFLLALLGTSFTNDRENMKNAQFYIEPLFSNRMFTLCIYHNAVLVEKLKDAQQSRLYLNTLLSTSKQEKMVDMLTLSLGDKVYGVGRLTLIGVVAEDIDRCMYDKLVTLAIVQRATLLYFSNQLALIAGLDKQNLVIGIGRLYEIYIQFINQMYFNEVTVDVQGTSIYDALFKQLNIKEEMKELDFEIREVHEYSSLIQKRQGQIRMDLLTIVGAILVIPTFVTGFFGMNVLEDRFVRWWVHKDVLLFLNSYLLLPIEVVLLIYSWCTKSQRYYKVWELVLGFCVIVSFLVLATQGCGLAR